MWICPQCHQQNQEDTVLCIKCSASRPTGRFNTASLQISSGIAAPRVAPAAEMRHAPDPYTRPSPVEPAPRPKAAEAPPAPYRIPPAPPAHPPRHRAIHSFARLIGRALMLLLPLLALLIAWRQYDALSGPLTSLLLSADAPQWARYAVYGVFCLAGLLLSLLPGVSLLAKLPPRHHKPKAKEAS